MNDCDFLHIMMVLFFLIFACKHDILRFLWPWSLSGFFCFFAFILRQLRFGFFGSIYLFYLSCCEFLIHYQRSMNSVSFDLFDNLAFLIDFWIIRFFIDKFYSFLFILHHNFLVWMRRILRLFLLFFLVIEISFGTLYF